MPGARHFPTTQGQADHTLGGGKPGARGASPVKMRSLWPRPRALRTAKEHIECTPVQVNEWKDRSPAGSRRHRERPREKNVVSFASRGREKRSDGGVHNLTILLLYVRYGRKCTPRREREGATSGAILH